MAAPTHDATTITSTTFTNVQNPTVSHTRGVTCPNAVAFITVSWQDSTPGTLTSVTYDGNATTTLHNSVAIGGGLNEFIAAFLYKNPPSGAATVQANFSESINGVIIRVSTYANVDQTTSTGTVATNTATSGTTATVDVSSAVGELVVDGAVTNTGITLTVDNSQTERFNISLSGNHKMGGSEEDGEAGTTTMSWGLSGSTPWGIIGVSLKPAADSGSSPMMFRGA